MNLMQIIHRLMGREEPSAAAAAAREAAQLAARRRLNEQAARLRRLDAQIEVHSRKRHQ